MPEPPQHQKSVDVEFRLDVKPKGDNWDKDKMNYREKSQRRFGIDVHVVDEAEAPPETDFQRVLAFLQDLRENFQKKRKRNRQKWAISDEILERLAAMAVSTPEATFEWKELNRARAAQKRPGKPWKPPKPHRRP